MNRSELAERPAGRGMNKAAAKDAVEGAFGVIGDTLGQGQEARIVGGGIFGTESRSAHTARNRWTGENVPIASSRVSVFKAGKMLKVYRGQRRVMNGARIRCRGHAVPQGARSLNQRAYATMTGVCALRAGHRQESKRHLGFGQVGQPQSSDYDVTGRNKA